MAKGNEGLPSIAAMPDVRALFGSWDELSAQMSQQSTALSRDALAAGLRVFEQSASNAGHWMQTLGQGARRISELAQATERRIGAAEDVAGVWNLEFGLLGETAQMAAAFGQEAWLALARTQAGLMQSALAQSEQSFERAVHAANGAVLGVDETAAAPPDQPVEPFTPAQWQAQWPAMAESMTQGAQALWNAMAASSAAAMQAPAEAEPAAAPAARPGKARKTRARKRSR
jgi:hypothetical protein